MQHDFDFTDPTHAHTSGAPREPASATVPDENGTAPRGDAGEARAALSAELEAALLRELRGTWARENWARFGERLRAPVLVLSDGPAHLGRWARETRTLSLSRALVLGRPWPEVVAVLLHEMAHQYVDEALGVTSEAAHGETFRRVCAERGVDARASGAPVAAEGAGEVDRALERIHKLLALAASPNLHEAEAAMRRAHALMLQHNLDAVGATAARCYEVRHVGDATRRVTRVENDVVSLVSRFFFVQVIRIPVYLPRIGSRGHVFELSGTRANVEMAVHVYAFLLATADRLWRENRRDARVASGRDRLAYQSGVVRGFADKLTAERDELRGTGLVWVGDADLDRFFRARHPRTVSRTRRVHLGGAHAAGREAGRSIVLHRPIEQGPSAASPRLLDR